MENPCIFYAQLLAINIELHYFCNVSLFKDVPNDN